MAVVEVPKVKIEKIGLKPFHEFDDANDTWPRGDRPAAIREAAAEFRARFATPGEPRSRRSHDRHRLGRLPAEVRLRRRGEGRPTPTSTSSTGCRSSSSRTSTASCGRSPTSRPSPRGRPRRRSTRSRSRSSASSSPTRSSRRSGTTPTRRSPRSGCGPRTSTSSASTTCTCRTCASCSGTTEPIPGEAAPRPPLFPNAKLITQRKEWDTFALAAPDAVGLVRRGRDQGPDRPTTSSCVDGDVELGKGVALVWTPGHTDGNHSPRASTPTTASGSPRRTASPPTPGTRTSRRSPASASTPSSSAAR